MNPTLLLCLEKVKHDHVPMRYLLLFSTLLCASCIGIPSGVSPVTDFDLNRYLGTWHEIARLDHSFERGLVKVHAHYSLNSDGTLRVVNRGYDPALKRWRESTGKARFVSNPSIGRLKVTFFWPFYGSYNIIRLDQERYHYAVICGSDKSYLWILSRTPEMEPRLLKHLIKETKELGFPVANLICLKEEEIQPCLQALP